MVNAGLGLVRLFYPWTDVSHLERLPSGAPVVVVANHPNGLLDPVVLRAALGRPVHFLAKSTFWGNPVGRWAMATFGALPAYRAHEADTSKNEATFATARALLRAGRWLALFPEGTSHDHPALLPLKSGAARIALGAAAEAGWTQPLHLLPVGLLYDDKTIFRSRVGVVVGEPIPVHSRRAAWEADPRAAAAALTDDVSRALGEVVLQADSAAFWRGIVAVATWTAPDGGADRAARDRRALRLAEAARTAAGRDPAALEAAVGATRRFTRVMEAVGVRDPFALEAPRPVALLGGLGKLVLLAPFALVGALLGWLPYRLVRPVALRLAAGHEDLVGTMKVLLGLVVLGLHYLLLAGLAAAWLGPLVGLATLVGAPLCGLAALRFDERLQLRLDALRGLWLSGDQRVAAAVSARRAELCRVVEGALGEAGGEPTGGEPGGRDAAGGAAAGGEPAEGEPAGAVSGAGGPGGEAAAASGAPGAGPAAGPDAAGRPPGAAPDQGA